MTHAEIYGSNGGDGDASFTPCTSQSMPAEQFTEVPERTEEVQEERNSQVEPSESTPILSRGDSSTTRTMRQQSFTEAYQIGKRNELDEKWAAFFYEANVSFNVVRHPTFIAAVEATSKAGFDYRPPTYNAMRTKHIEPTKQHVKMKIEEKTKQCISLYGATICSDGWDNVVNRPLMNVMLVCPVGDIFLGSIDTTGNKKDKGYIAEKMKENIEAVGPHNVVQICSDNASAMLGAMDEVVRDYPHIYKQGCAAHIMDLLLEDWGKEATFKELIILAKRIPVFIRRRHVTMALFRQFSPKLSLLIPAETRFGCQYLMIVRLLKVRAALLQVVVHQKWDEYVSTLFNRAHGHRKHALAALVRSTILDETFWLRCENLVHLMKPAVVTLKTFDGQTPAMGRAWLAMNNLKKHVFGLRGDPYFLDPAIAGRFETQFTRRWKMMLTDLHYAGALLNPYITYECRELMTSGIAKRARNRVLRHLSACLGVNHNAMMYELTQFEERTGPYGPLEAPDIRETRMLPHQWWQRVGGDALPLIAKRILSLTCSASSCERNWSMYSFVHNKVRNRLGVKKAEDLVYIYTNSKLLRERRGADPVILYDNQPFSEDSDVDVAAMHDGEDSDDEGDEGFDDGVEGHGGDGHDGGVHVDDGGMDDEDLELPMDNAGGDMPHNEPVNQPNGVFDWAGFDEEATASPNHVVNEIRHEGVVAYDRADDDIDDDFEDGINEHQSDNGGDNDDIHSVHSDSNNDNGGGGNNGGVQIPIPQDVEGGEEVDQPQGALPENVAETTQSGGLNESLPRNERSERVENGLEDEIPIGQLFQTPLAQNTPSIGAVLAGLGRPPQPRSSGSTGHGSITPTGNTSVPVTSSGTGPQAGPSTMRRGVKRSAKGPTNVRPFFSGYTVGTSSSLPVAVGKRRLPIINEDGITDKTKRRKVKRIVTTVVDGTIDHELRNIHSTVEEYAPVVYGDEDAICGDDEGSDGSDDSRAEAPDDEDIVLRVPLGRADTRKNPVRCTARKNKKN